MGEWCPPGSPESYRAHYILGMFLHSEPKRFFVLQKGWLTQKGILLIFEGGQILQNTWVSLFAFLLNLTQGLLLSFHFCLSGIIVFYRLYTKLWASRMKKPHPTYVLSTIILFEQDFRRRRWLRQKIRWPIRQVKLFISFPVISFQATSGYSPEGD